MEYDSTHGNNEGVEMAGALEDRSDASMILPRNLLLIRPMTNTALTSPASPEENTPAYDSIRFIEVRHSVVYVHTALWVYKPFLFFREFAPFFRTLNPKP
jgi:hypothetical protein